MASHRWTWLVAVMAALALVVPSAAAQELGTVTLLSDDFDEPDLYDWAASADGEWIVALLEDAPDENPPGLHAIPTDGGSAIELAAAPVGGFVVSGDSSTVAFWQHLAADAIGLFTVPISGGTPVLAAEIDSLVDTHEMQLSVDGDLVFFTAAETRAAKRELFAVTADGLGTPTRLSRRGREVRRFQLVDSRQRVVYETARCTIYSVPFGGGQSARLSKGQSTARCDATPTPDGSRVVFTAYRNTDDDKLRLFSTPITGGAPRRLNSGLVEGGRVLQFAISADSSRVVYRADAEAIRRHELFSVPVDRGSRAVKLHPSPPRWADVRSNFVISPDSTTVVYRQDGEHNGVTELYAVPLGGGARQKLNPEPTTNGDVRQLLVTTDSTMVVYRGDMLVNRQYELFAVGLDGTNHRRLNPPLRRSGDVRAQFVDAADASTVAYRSDWSANRDDTFVVDLGTGVVSRVSGVGVGIDLIDDSATVGETGALVFSGSFAGQNGAHVYLVPPQPS